MKSNDVSSFFHRYFPISQRDEIWGLYATSAGDRWIAPNTGYPPRVSGQPERYTFDWQHGRILNEFAFVYISSGRGKFESERNYIAAVEPGHAFLLFPGVWHRYAPDPKTGWHEHWIGFDGQFARYWFQKRFISKKNPVLKINPEDTVLSTFSRVMQSIHVNRPALQQILAGATAYLIGLLYSAQQGQPFNVPQDPNVIGLAIARLQNEFASDWDMKLMAQELGVSYSCFRHKFTAHTGLSPQRYLRELRLVRARNLLTETNFRIKEIAAQTGFEDEHYFCRIFRQTSNYTPSEWRVRSRRRK